MTFYPLEGCYTFQPACLDPSHGFLDVSSQGCEETWDFHVFFFAGWDMISSQLMNVDDLNEQKNSELHCSLNMTTMSATTPHFQTKSEPHSNPRAPRLLGHHVYHPCSLQPMTFRRICQRPSRMLDGCNGTKLTLGKFQVEPPKARLERPFPLGFQHFFGGFHDVL